MRNSFGRRRFYFFPVVIVLALLLFSFGVYWLWNNVLVAVVSVKPVTYWQAMGLLVLARMLLGGFKVGPPGGGRPPWREKWHQMSEEERAKFKSEWRKRGEGRL